jgi:hypothetical protein
MNYNLRVSLLFIVFFLCGASRSSIASQRDAVTKTGGPLSINLSKSRGKFVPGAVMPVTIELKNTSSSDAWFESKRPDPSYTNFQFLLTTDGVEPPTTIYHRLITGRQLPSDPTAVWSGSSMFAKLTPGESVQFAVDVTKLYVIPAAGEYVLSVRMFLNQSNEMWIRSKPLYLEVTQNRQSAR